ncbi:MAG: carboxymuconolactone decarboxylase family protein [Armatimonadota bacterium]
MALADGDLSSLPPREQALLRYVGVLTREPSKVTDAMGQSLRSLGWSDEELFETSFITALFAFFNRMAEAYGLGFDGAWRPPAGSVWDKTAPAKADAKPSAPSPAPAKPARPTGKPGVKPRRAAARAPRR